MNTMSKSTKQKNTLEVGMVLSDKWVILELIGRGGMGEVYRAHQLNLKRDVAIKVVSHEFLQSVCGDDYEVASSLERFRREVQVMAQIKHPNILHIFDHDSISIKKGEEETLLEFMAMEYVAGGATLRSTMSEEGFYPAEDAVRAWLSDYFLPLLDGIQAIHEVGIVHRDLKPENVLLEGKTPKIADFGLARSCRVKPVTQSMDVKGTPPYMSPEHFLDLKRTDQRTDIYALGKILYEAVSGKMGPDEIPFRVARLSKAETPFFQKLDRIIQEATSEDKEQRPSSARVLKEAVEEALAKAEGTSFLDNTVNKVRKWKTPMIVALIVLAVGLGAGLGMHLLHQDSEMSMPSRPVETPGSGEGRAPATQPAPASPVHPGSPSTPKPQESDYDVMRPVPGGHITLPDNFGPESGKTIDVEPFYMNETLITNEQYVHFLNEVLPRLKVENGMVHGDGRIWLLLGEVQEGYEPIVYRDGKFHVQNAAHGSCPVLRVTGYGASEYTGFFGLRLPTETEWLFAAMEGNNPAERSSGTASGEMSGDGMHTRMQKAQPVTPKPSEAALPVDTPVIMFKPNLYGIRGLNKNIGEWAMRMTRGPASGEKREIEYMVLGGPYGKEEPVPSGVRQNPGEAFDRVGFRCVRDGAGK